LGHAVSVLGIPAYDLLAGANKDPPNPGPAPVVLAGATSAQLMAAHCCSIIVVCDTYS
jgi:hypothetical protein